MLLIQFRLLVLPLSELTSFENENFLVIICRICGIIGIKCFRNKQKGKDFVKKNKGIVLFGNENFRLHPEVVFKKILVNQERLKVEDMDELRHMLYLHVYDCKC